MRRQPRVDCGKEVVDFDALSIAFAEDDLFEGLAGVCIGADTHLSPAGIGAALHNDAWVSGRDWLGLFGGFLRLFARLGSHKESGVRGVGVREGGASVGGSVLERHPFTIPVFLTGRCGELCWERLELPEVGLVLIYPAQTEIAVAEEISV